VDARAAAVIRIDAVWLAVNPIDMRTGVDRLLASVVQVFGAAQAHHGYLFANARSTRIRLLVAYFRPSRTAFQADRGRHFSVIADGVSV
jgi:hypothetical protein